MLIGLADFVSFRYAACFQHCKTSPRVQVTVIAKPVKVYRHQRFPRLGDLKEISFG